ncbi:cell wall-active antibiotics response protein LiaF [Alicyclobacillus fodiniaquatilis]|jgi:lia operon protein LiaF|uniref:Cell wall-active antibiotics response protein LiaF n=1 Tax=Alicyclobacillus fodiniaquatilis TaxID=1661150 RepID=A0ABW4JDJ3_9BACL
MGRNAAIGSLVVIIGIVYLLIQMNLMPVSISWTSGAVLWPLLLVIFGCFGLNELGRRRKIPWGSLFMIVLGLVYALKGTGQFPGLNQIGYWSLLFTLAVIFIGLSFIVPRRRKRRDEPSVHNANQDDEMELWEESEENDSKKKDTDSTNVKTVEVVARKKDRNQRKMEWRVIGDLSLGKSTWVLHDMNLWNGIGDVRINLATAHIEDGSYQIEISGWIGDVRVLVPEDLPVSVEAGVSLGDVVVFGDRNSGTGRFIQVQDANFATASRRCRIFIDLRIGDVEVVRV